MGIYRVEKNKNYVVMNRTALNDERLTWKAKGIIAYMLSLPDDWTFYIEEIVKHAKDGEAAFRSGLKELKDYGYVKRFPVREGQRIKHWETVIYEVPQQKENSLDGEIQQVEPLDGDSLLVDSLHVDSLDVENRGLLSTDINQVLNTPNTDITNFIFEYWNSKGIIKHKKLTDAMKKHINARLKDYSEDEVKEAINNYVTIVNSEEYFLNYKWTLKDFMTPDRFEKFVTSSNPFDSYRKSGSFNKGGYNRAKDDDARKFVEENGLSF
jgi:hypothetical protein